MLGYELFSINKESPGSDPRGRSQPIKKIFFQKGIVTLDKDLEEYTSECLEKTKQLQDCSNFSISVEDIILFTLYVNK
ncbi:MAG: hypothetical protein O3C48_05215, partial [Crenarchaeota archaeon]|nr:hypothetical protein [Thermoproteota archaeon]